MAFENVNIVETTDITWIIIDNYSHGVSSGVSAIRSTVKVPVVRVGRSIAAVHVHLGVQEEYQ